MYIKKIHLNHFRNYHQQEIEFNPHINIFYGNNAQGKTNIIEAIFLCAYGKSFRSKKDKELIQFGEKSSKIEILYEMKDRAGKISSEIGESKIFFVNDIKQKKMSDILGKIHIVIFTPDDIEIIKGGPKERRKFLDMMISSLRPHYVHLLNHYNQILEQRNYYLKKIKLEDKPITMLDIWDEQLAEDAAKIYTYRKYFIEKIEEKIQDIHNIITKSGKEAIKIKYISNGSTKEIFEENLKKSRQVDIYRGFTGIGIHRDDFMIYINDRQVSIFGSQGQQRTVVLTLKICELNIVKEELQETPILLLDDFMSELDEQRRKNFLENIKDSQVIITCTDKIAIDVNQSNFLIEDGVCQNG